MSNKIEHIEINGKQMPVSMFPDDVKELVLSYELARDKRNEHVTMTHALGTYMNELTNNIKTRAVSWLNEQYSQALGEGEPEAATSEDVIVGE